MIEVFKFNINVQGSYTCHCVRRRRYVEFFNAIFHRSFWTFHYDVPSYLNLQLQNDDGIKPYLCNMDPVLPCPVRNLLSVTHFLQGRLNSVGGVEGCSISM